VVKLITGHDGKTREAVVKVRNRSDWTTTLRNLRKSLYPLELKARTSMSNQEGLFYLLTTLVIKLPSLVISMPRSSRRGHSDEQL